MGDLSGGLGPLLGGSRPLTDLSEVIKNALERIHAEFGTLLHTAAASNDAERKRLALSYLHASRQQLLRLVALVQWHPKAKATLGCIGTGQVLDTARKHTQMLEAAAVELYEAHMRRQPDFSPMFDVQTALDVLSTGTYNDLPSSIEKLRGASQQSEEQQRRRLRRISHLVSSSLLKVNLPEGAVVSDVREGWALLRVEGLYDARITLVPGLQLPEEPVQAASAQGPAEGVQGGGLAAAGGAAAQAGTSAAAADEDEEVSSGKPVTQRWRWLLLDFSIPVNGIQGPALHEAQVTALLQDLNNRMHVAADAAVYAKRRELAAAAAGAAQGVVVEEPAGVAVSTQPSASRRSSAMPQPSGTTSRMTGGDAAAVAARGGVHHAHNLALLARQAADELSAPLAVMHSVLADVAGRLLVDAARAVAQQLVGSSGCWVGNAQVEPGTSSGLGLGFTLSFWSRAIPLLPLPAPPAAGLTALVPAAGAGATRGRAAAGSDPVSQRPRLEIGVAANGSVQVLCNVSAPTIELQGQPGLGESSGSTHVSVQQPEVVSHAGTAAAAMAKQAVLQRMQLDAVRVNVDELLLRAATNLAWQELSALQQALTKELQNMAVAGTSWEVRVTTSKTHCLPLTAQPVVDALSVQQALSTSNPTATQAARQARAIHASDHNHPHTTGTTAAADTQQLGFSTPADGGIGSGAQQGAEAHGRNVQEASQVARGLEIEIEFPVVELSSQGQVLMRVSKSLFTGRFLLHPGLAGDSNIQSMANWSSREDELNNLVAKIHNTPSGTTGQSGQPATSRALHEAAHRLAVLFKDQQRSMAISTTMTVARRLHLHLGGASTRLMTAFHTEQVPWVDFKRFYALWSLPPSPFPPTFPPLYSSPPGTQPCMQPRNLSFVLGGDHPASTSGAYSLFVVACTDQMLPVKVLKGVLVPTHVYTPHSPATRTSQQAGAATENGTGTGTGTGGTSGPLGGRLGRGGSHSLPTGAAASGDMQHSGDMQVDTEAVSGSGRHLLQSTSSSAAARHRGHRPQREPQQHQQGEHGAAGGGVAGIRDIAAELSAVVAWCQRHSVWEKLIFQLEALCADFQEATLADPGSGCIRLRACAGIAIPCRIAQRKGLYPPRVGMHRVTLAPGKHVESQQVHMVVQGCWFSSDGGGDGRGAGGSGMPVNRLHRQHTRPPQQQHHAEGFANGDAETWNSSFVRGPSSTSIMQGAGEARAAVPAGWPGLRAESVTWRGGGTVRFTYSLAHGQSVLDMVADLLSMVRMQTFLARMEAMATDGMHLHVLHAGTAHASDHHITTVHQEAPVMLPVKREWDADMETAETAAWDVSAAAGLPAKRAKGLSNGYIGLYNRSGDSCNGRIDEPGTHQADGTNGIAHTASGGHQGQSGSLVWTWGSNGSVELTSYGASSATFVHHAPGSNLAAAGKTGAGCAQAASIPGGSSQLIKIEPNSFVKKEQPSQSAEWVGATGSVALQDTAKAGAQPLSFTVSWQAGSAWDQLWQARGQAHTPVAPVAATARTPQEARTVGPPGTPLPHAISTSAGFTSSPSAPRVEWNDLLACRISMANERHASILPTPAVSPPSALASAQAAGQIKPASAAGPLASFLESVQQMAELGEEGLLLDALAVAARPMHAAQAALDAVIPSRPCGMAGHKPGDRLPVLHVPDRGPFQHELMVPLQVRQRPQQAAAGAGQQQSYAVVIRLLAMAVGRTWLHLSVPSSWRGAAGFLTRLVHQVQEQLGQERLHVASSWSQLLTNAASTPRGTTTTALQATGAASTRRQLWVLVGNADVEQALRIVLQGCLQPVPETAT